MARQANSITIAATVSRSGAGQSTPTTAHVTAHCLCKGLADMRSRTSAGAGAGDGSAAGGSTLSCWNVTCKVQVKLAAVS